MTFVMKLDFVDTVVDDSLVNTYINEKKIGYEFQIRKPEVILQEKCR